MVRRKVETKKSSPKIKRMRDKNAPKVPVNPYSRFLKENLKKFRKENEKSNEANARLAAEWGKMSDLEKKPYRDEYIKAREEYFEQMNEYKNTAQYKDYQRVKTEKRRRSRKAGGDEKDVKAVFSKNAIAEGVKIFNEEFLNYNKGQEKKFRETRKQKNNIDEECERIREHIGQMNEQIRKTREENLNREKTMKDIDVTMSNWQKIIIEALAEAKLLDHLKLNQKSTINDLIGKLEEITSTTAKNATENSRLQSAVKHALVNLQLESI